MTAPSIRQAIVLAAGEGRRLLPMTLTTPKPLVPFWGRPLLDWAIDKLAAAGVERVAVNAHHLADKIERRVERLAARYPAIDFHVARETELLGTGGAVRNLRYWLIPGERFFVLSAKAIFEADVRVVTHAEAADAALLVTREPLYASIRRVVGDGGDGGDGGHPHPRFCRFDEAADPERGFAFCGLTLADPGLPARLPDGPSCILRQGFVPYLDEVAVALVETDGFFADTSTADALVDAHMRGRAWVSSLGRPPTAVTSRGTSPTPR